MRDVSRRRRRRTRCGLAASVLVMIAVGIAGAAAGPKPEPGPDLTDMWTPEWPSHGVRSPDPQAPPRMTRRARHQPFIDRGVPDEYRGERNRYPRSPEVLREGRGLYSAHCRDCHGSQGTGDGDLGLAVNPSPALLAYMVQMPLAVDDYLMWSLSAGGAPFGSGMPAIKDRLSVGAIWKIITYMRAGFPRGE